MQMVASISRQTCILAAVIVAVDMLTQFYKCTYHSVPSAASLLWLWLKQVYKARKLVSAHTHA